MGSIISGLETFRSNGRWFAIIAAVRPIVSLNNDITLDDLQVVSGTLTTWEYEFLETAGDGDADTGLVEKVTE